MRAEYFLLVHHTTNILAKLSTWCFEHSDDSCSLLINLSHTDESWEGWNMCLWMYTLWIYSLPTLENIDENRIFFVHSPHHKHFCKAQHLVPWGLWWHQLFTTCWTEPQWWVLGRMKHMAVDIYIYIYIYYIFVYIYTNQPSQEWTWKNKQNNPW